MDVFDSYREFLESSYKNWVPKHEDADKLMDTPVLFVAYTDYGGDFLDRVVCEFIQEFALEESYIVEGTIYSGENLLYFGAMPAEDYLLANFPDINECFEDYYYEKFYEAEQESFEYFVSDLFKDRRRLKDWAMEKLTTERSGYYSPMPDGTIDFCSRDLEKWLLSQPRR